MKVVGFDYFVKELLKFVDVRDCVFEDGMIVELGGKVC